MWRGGGQQTAAPILGARCRSAADGVSISGCAAGAAPWAAQAASVVAAAAHAAAERHGDLAPSAAVPTAERAGSASAATAATTAAAGCQAASRGAEPGGGPPPVAATGGDVASAPPPLAPDGHRHRAPRPVVRGAAMAEWSETAYACHPAAPLPPPARAAMRPPSAAAEIAAAFAATSPATDHRAARCAVPQRGDERQAVTELDVSASLAPPAQVAPAGGSMVVAPIVGAAAIPASTEAGYRHAAGASVLQLAGAVAAAAAFPVSLNG